MNFNYNNSIKKSKKTDRQFIQLFYLQLAYAFAFLIFSMIIYVEPFSQISIGLQLDNLRDYFASIFFVGNKLLIRLFAGAALFSALFLVLHHFGKLYGPIQERPFRNNQIRKELAFATLWLLSTCVFNLPLSWIILSGYSQIYLDTATYGLVYTVLSFIILIFVFDAYFYWAHRILHTPFLYRHIHKVHHLSIRPTPLTQLATSPLEQLVISLFLTLIVCVLPLHPNVIISFSLLGITRSYMGHSGYECFNKAFINNKFFSQFVTNTHHDLHHSSFQHNFSFFFTFWDRYFKTEHPEYRKRFFEVLEKTSKKNAK